MLIEITFALLIGILSGTLTGLTPGIHINLLGALLLSTIFLPINPVYLIIFIISMSITHTFIDFIPSIILGCPDTDTELGILPGQKLLQNGKGYEAILLTTYGSLIAIFIIVIIAFPSLFLIKKAYPFLEKIIPYFLILISIILISTERKKLTALKIFLLTGFLGYSITFLEINQPLLPLLTGLFGSSIIIKSIKNKTKIPEQTITKPLIRFKKPILASLLSAPLCSFLPGLGSGQAGLIGNLFTRNNPKEFLTLLGITNTLVMAFSIITLFAINKTRTGSAAFIGQLIPNLEIKHLILILFVVIISGVVSFYLTLWLGKVVSLNVSRINYRVLAFITLGILVLVIGVVSGILGLGVFILSTLTGLYCLSFKVRRTNMMGALMVPSVIFYLF
jgi:putative membrane protein